MPRVVFTPNLQRHVPCPPGEVTEDTVHGVLEAVFATNRRVRDYILDDQGALRKHMMIFVNGRQIVEDVSSWGSVSQERVQRLYP